MYDGTVPGTKLAIKVALRQVRQGNSVRKSPVSMISSAYRLETLCPHLRDHSCACSSAVLPV
jgi:hypothetical protein